MIKLIGILVVALGFALRANTLLVVVAAGVITGLVAGMSFHEIVAQFGAAFVDSRYMTLPVVLMLPLIGMLERHGLRERAEILIRRTRAATAGRVLLVYSIARQVSISLGVRIGEHASAVRPLVAPMAEAAAMNQMRRGKGAPPAPPIGATRTSASADPAVGGARCADGASLPGTSTPPCDEDTGIQRGQLPPELVHSIRAHAAAAENVGNFFGEDIFVAVGAVLLMSGFFQSVGVEVSILALALWGIPTAFVAAGLMYWRLRVLDRRIERVARGGEDR